MKQTLQCPICNSAFSPDTTDAMPFCSERCRSIDLGRWFEEEYSLPLVPDPEDDEQPEEPWSVPPSPSAEEQDG